MTCVDTASTGRAELVEFVSTLGERVRRLEAPADGTRAVVLPSYGGTRRLPNLTPLLALLLRRYGVPVVVHGPVEAARGSERVTTAAVLRELGIEPAMSIADAEQRLVHGRVVYLPVSVLAPGLVDLLASRRRMGLRGEPDVLVQFVDPFAGAGLRVIGVSRPEDLQWVREVLTATRADALLLRGIDGEPFADPLHEPELESFAAGVPTVLFEAGREPPAEPARLPDAPDAASTAAWIVAVLEGEQPVPPPIVDQLACCLLATRRTPGAG